MRLSIRRSVTLVILGLFLVGAACGADGAEMGASGGGGAGAVADRARPAPAQVRGGELQAQYGADSDQFVAASEGKSSAARAPVGAAVGRAPAVPQVGPEVIKTADIRLEVGRNDVRDAVQDAIALANRFQGFVVSSSVSDEGSGRADLVIRVPSVSFETALDQLDRLGDVTDENVSGQDVSEEFVDLEARLRNARAQEAVLLRLMDRSATVADTIRVQSELQGVQLEIERLRGRLRFLEDQTAMGTIAVSILEAGGPPPRPNPLARAWAIAKRTTVGIVTAVIVGAGFVLPVAAFALLALLLLAPVWRRFKPRLQT